MFKYLVTLIYQILTNYLVFDVAVLLQKLCKSHFPQCEILEARV